MRIDKFLKLSRIIKRRTLANEACEAGRVKINGKVAKPSSEVKPGDIIEISFGNKMTKVEVLSVAEHVTKEGAAELFRILE
ncbi:MAG TPA: RNA-binding S4 domain-containing protein [Clostridiaceae bacterium]|nr:RNA-binding S4 domain-containing protein [Clostridiaceae bacterium]